MGQIRKFKNEVEISSDHLAVKVNGTILTFDNVESSASYYRLFRNLCCPLRSACRLAHLNGQGNK